MVTKMQKGSSHSGRW